MKFSRLSVLIGLLPLSLFSLGLVPLGAYAGQSVLDCDFLIDVEQGWVLENQAIVVDDTRIVAVTDSRAGDSRNPFDAYQDLLPGADNEQQYFQLRYCLPGLIDMHVHLDGQLARNAYIKRFQQNPTDYALIAADHARKTLLAGFTTVRNPGDAYNSTIALRNAIDKGIAIGPRIYSAGKSLATTGGHADPTNGYRSDLMGDPGPHRGVVNGVADARKAVRQRYKEGADFIKITATGGVLSLAKSGQNPQFAMDELEAIVTTAAEYGMHVAAHAHGTEGMRRAVQAGVRSIEHGSYMDDSVMRLMKQKGTFYVPTILAGVFVGEKAQEEGYFPDVVRPKAAAIGPVIKDTFARAYKAGVKIAFGTDSGVSAHGDNAEEFVHMVNAGMKPMEAIQAATLAAAELLNETGTLGSISPGKQADIVAVADNPLEDISELQNIRFVMKAGTVYKTELD